MFIQTETTTDSETMKFLPGQDVFPGGPSRYDDAATATRSPLARRLLDVEDVAAVELGAEYIAVVHQRPCHGDLFAIGGGRRR